MFVAYVYPHKYHSENRKVEPLFDNKFVLNLITNRISDEKVDNLQNGIWLFETERELKDRNGNPFRICKPVRFLGESHDMFSQPYVHEALAFVFDEDAETTDRRFGKDTRAMLGCRAAYHAGQDADNIWTWVKEQMTTGDISMKDLGQWVSTPVPIEWSKAKLFPAMRNLRSERPDSVFYFRDLNSYENKTLEIRTFTLDQYRSAIPDYLRITRFNRHQMSLEVFLDKVASVSDATDPFYGNALEMLQQTGAFWLTVTPYADQPDNTFEIGIEKDTKNFQAMLERFSIKELNGQYVPEKTPDWMLEKIEGNRFEDDICEITSPQTCMVKVNFTNGMSGRYPIIYMMKRYPGKCLNAEFSARGYSLDTMRVTVVRK